MLLLVADEAFGFVRVESEEGGRGKWGGGSYHCALHCSLHPPEYATRHLCNLDVFWCFLCRMIAIGGKLHKIKI